jgi:hypothetical protein
MRDIALKVFFAEDDVDNNYIEPLRINSEWVPEDIPSDIKRRIFNFENEVHRHFKPRKGISNISKHQATILESIQKNENVIICHADKNLGPVAIDTDRYIQLALDKHLRDTNTYVQLSEEDANMEINDLNKAIFKWTRKHSVMAEVSIDACKYIRYHTMKNRADPYGYFYLLMKIHKIPMSTRPVCSDCASIIHPLGKWLDVTLQPIVRTQFAYFKDTFTLKRELNDLRLTSNASLITFDAVSMYTNINIDDCIERLSEFLRTILPKIEYAG